MENHPEIASKSAGNQCKISAKSPYFALGGGVLAVARLIRLSGALERPWVRCSATRIAASSHCLGGVVVAVANCQHEASSGSNAVFRH